LLVAVKGVRSAVYLVGKRAGGLAVCLAALRADSTVAWWVPPSVAKWAAAMAACSEARKAGCLVGNWAARSAVWRAGPSGVLWVVLLAAWTADLWAETRVVRLVDHWVEHLVESSVASTAALSVDRTVVTLDFCSAAKWAALKAARRVEQTAGRLVDNWDGSLAVRSVAQRAAMRAASRVDPMVADSAESLVAWMAVTMDEKRVAT